MELARSRVEWDRVIAKVSGSCMVAFIDGRRDTSRRVAKGSMGLIEVRAVL